MNPPNSRDRSLIASLSPHIDAAIRASPCTCVPLRRDVILDLVLRHGLDPDRRIPEFLRLCLDAQAKFGQDTSDHADYPEMTSLADDNYQVMVPASKTGKHNENLNNLYQRYGLGEVVRDCEELAVAYGASLRHAWANTTVLSRYVGDIAELDSMLATREFRSTEHNFVSTSVTKSPWLKDRDISYSIKVTEQYRKHAFPLSHTSVFVTPDPEILQGPKTFRVLEDEIRMENGTPIEEGTLEITFHPKTPIPNSQTEEITKRYAPLGPVRFKLY